MSEEEENTVTTTAQDPPPVLLVGTVEQCKQTLDILDSDPKIAGRMTDAVANELVESLCEVLKKCVSTPSEAPEWSVIDAVVCLRILCRLCRGEAMVKSTSNAANIVVCASKGVCEVVCSVLSVYAADSEVAECCGLLIMILSSDNVQNQLAFSDAGICAQLMLAIEHNMEHPHIMDILLRASRNLGSNLIVAAKLISEGISEKLAKVAGQYIGDAVVTEALLWVVVNLSCDSDAATIMGQVGVCSIICDILARWPDNPELCRGGCWAIRNLACAEACNYAVLASTNVVSLLLATLSTHKMNAKVCEQALWALANIGFDQEISVKIIESGVVSLLSDIANIILTRDRDLMATPAMFSLIAMDEAFLWAIRNLSSASEGNNVYFNDKVIQQCVVILLREYGRDPKLGEAAMGAIGNLIHNNDEASVSMGPFFMVEAVAQVTCGYFSDEIVLGTGLKTLFFMCKVYQARMKEIGLDKVGAASIKAYPDNETVVRYGCEILLNTYYTDEESRLVLRAASAIDEEGRVLKIETVEARNEAWIPDRLVKLNEWFKTADDPESEEDGEDRAEKEMDLDGESKEEETTADSVGAFPPAPPGNEEHEA